MTVSMRFICLMLLALISTLPAGQQEQKKTRKKDEGKKEADRKEADAATQSKASRREPPATLPSAMKVAKGFQVELLYSVPKDQQGSWVNLAVDPKGRLIVSDQYGKLYRVKPPQLGAPVDTIRIETIDLPIGQAQGLLCAFDSLYVMVANEAFEGSGLYRVRDTNGDDQYDEVKLLRKLPGGGEHGPHAIVLSPDGTSLYIVAGNQTKLTDVNSSRVPRVWSEDHLLPRMWDGRGFMKGVLAPGGWICRTDPDGREWELISTGFRNQYDAAFNRDGELFTYDADMEWDMNTPWYRPTRVCHVVSGAEFGWRSGAGKWPAYYLDSVPAAVDVGPGSPTGIAFGYGAKFPAKYQEALFLCDWSYGKLYATHFKPEGSTYRGELEEFVTGTPLPLTDVVVNPHDGALYFAIGGRKTKSGFYRVTYAGSESIAPSAGSKSGHEARALRKKLESFHAGNDPAAVKTVWPYLGHQDRFLRYAARIALEHQIVSEWQDRALAETDPIASLSALVALIRVGDKGLQPMILKSLDRIEWKSLNDSQRIDLLRVYGLCFVRQGAPDDHAVASLTVKLEPQFPAASRDLNAELCKMLVYLGSPTAAAKTVALLQQAPTQEEQIEYAAALRVLKNGWTSELRRAYFEWFLKAANYKGGASFDLFVKNIKEDAVATLSDKEQEAFKELLNTKPVISGPSQLPARPLVREWKMDEILALIGKGLKGRNFNNGRAMFAAGNCFGCHRFANEGGATGPDLTGVAARFSQHDLLETILEPSKAISDQYAAVEVETTNGRIIVGRIVNLNNDVLMINTNMLDPNAQEHVDRKEVERLEVSKVSMMPQGLLNTFKQDDLLDLLAYLLSRADPRHSAFQ